MSSKYLEHKKFKQFLKKRKLPGHGEASTDEGSQATIMLGESEVESGPGERTFSAIKQLQARQERERIKGEDCSKRTGRRRGPGRPPKPEEEKVRLVSMKLPPDILAELKDLPFGRGVGSRVCELLSYFKRQERKEIARANLLRKLLGPFDHHLHNYLKMAKIDPQSTKTLALLEKLLQLSKKIQMMVEIFHWNGTDFKAYLKRDEVLTLQFALDFKREICENRSFQQIL